VFVSESSEPCKEGGEESLPSAAAGSGAGKAQPLTSAVCSVPWDR